MLPYTLYIMYFMHLLSLNCYIQVNELMFFQEQEGHKALGHSPENVLMKSYKKLKLFP